jgi:hypothetical protein
MTTDKKQETGLRKRQRYESSEPQPIYHYEVMVGPKLVRRNQECTLERGIGYPAGRYAFRFAEERHDGSWCLTFFGPVRRRKMRWRQVWDIGQVRTVHREVSPGAWAGAAEQA